MYIIIVSFCQMIYGPTVEDESLNPCVVSYFTSSSLEGFRVQGMEGILTQVLLVSELSTRPPSHPEEDSGIRAFVPFTVAGQFPVSTGFPSHTFSCCRRQFGFIRELPEKY
jgi:hypothetical protein